MRLDLEDIQSFTDVEIKEMLERGEINNGVFIYDSINHSYIGMINGTLVQFAVSPYP